VIGAVKVTDEELWVVVERGGRALKRWGAVPWFALDCGYKQSTSTFQSCRNASQTTDEAPGAYGLT
jgi:hypothetical protein